MCGELHLVQWGGDWVQCPPTQAPLPVLIETYLAAHPLRAYVPITMVMVTGK